MRNRILTLAAAGLLVTACSRGSESAATTVPTTEPTTTAPKKTTTTTSTTSTTTTTVVAEVPRMPLTGIPLDGAEVPDRPALVVKISNAPLSVIPQAGLNEADIVFEEVINDASTRFAAVFHSQSADPVGPVRSGRHQDIDTLSVLNHPLFAWSGGNKYVTRQIRDSDLVDMSVSNASGYERRKGREAPNNLYTTTDAIWEQAPAEAGRPGQIFSYLPVGEKPSGEDVPSFELKLDSMHIEWKYDAETNRYFRWENGTKHTAEGAEGITQVWADNVVIVFADYGVNPNDGNPEAKVLGSNPVVVMSGGKMQKGVWMRAEPTDPYQFVTAAEGGDPILVAPGRTWVEIPRNKESNLTVNGSSDSSSGDSSSAGSSGDSSSSDSSTSEATTGDR